jgi:hypothetical protein
MTIRSSLLLQISLNLAQRYNPSSKMLQFLNIICNKIFETFSIFCHNLHVSYHHIMANIKIFRLFFFFKNFKTTQPHIYSHVL